MTDILKNSMGISEILDVMSSVMRVGSDPKRREGRPSDCFVYVAAGVVDYIFEESIYTVSQGSVMYLPRGSTYKMRVKMEYHPIYIDFQFISSELMPTAVHDLHGLEAIFRRTLKHWLKGSKSSMLCCMGGLYEIYGKMMEQRRTGYISEESRALARRAEAQMIERLSDRNLKMTEIAEHIGISTAHLRRIFYATFGVAPNSYLQQKRIQKARLLLLESDFSMEQIAEATGFCNAYYFSRVFRSFNGMPPGAYRQENGR